MKKIFTWPVFIGIVIGFVVFMAVGTFYDYEISIALYNGSGNLLTDIVAAVGFMPTVFCAMGGGVMIYNSDTHRYKLVTFVKRFILFGCTAFSFYYLFDEYLENSSFIPGLIVEAVFLVAFSFMMFSWTKKYQNKNKLVLFGLFLVSLACAQIIVNLLCKHIFLRPRMNYIFTGATDFQVWYDFNNEAGKIAIANGVSESCFASFPSGHSTCAAAMSAIWVLGEFKEKFKNREVLLFVLGLVYTALVGFMRIWCGDHFFSDIVWGVTISLVTQFVCYAVYLKGYAKEE